MPFRRPSTAWPPWRDNRRILLAVVGLAALALAIALAVAGRLQGRADLAEAGRAAAVGAWFAILMAALRMPPRARAPAEGGVPVLRASFARRLALPLMLAPLAALAIRRAIAEPEAGGGPVVVVVLLAIGGIAWFLRQKERRFALGPEGIGIRLGGRPRALLPWDRIAAVRIELVRSHAGLVLLGAEGSPSIGVSVWLDGSAELAAALLARAPAEALAAPGLRQRLEALARPVGEGPAR